MFVFYRHGLVSLLEFSNKIILSYLILSYLILSFLKSLFTMKYFVDGIPDFVHAHAVDEKTMFRS